MSERWGRRVIPPELAGSWRREGWWTDKTLGQLVSEGLQGAGSATLTVHSRVRPWSGTFAEIDVAARQLAGAWQARGVGPGSVVVLQLPNWAEAAISFWAAAYVAAVVVPVVHFYGPKELAHILAVTDPAVVVTADRFGSVDHLTAYEELLGRRGHGLWMVVGDTPARELPRGATPFTAVLGGDPLTGPVAVDPDAPAIIGFTSGTTRDPKGVVHSHRTIGFEARQLDHMFPKGGPPGLTGAPVGHFIGMVNALLVPVLRRLPVNLVDVWDPTEVLRLMRTHHLAMSGGAPYFLTSLIDHPGFTREHLALMPHAGLGGSSVPAAFMDRLGGLGIKAFRSYRSTEHPSITGCLISEPEDKRHRTDGRALPGVELRLTAEGEIQSRGPDCCIGYTDPTLTAAVFDADGWYTTGDVGVLDEDGYLTITDRISDVIIRGGENISAVEVEDLLLGLPQIAEVSVVARPDVRLGERAAAVVILRPGSVAPTVEDLQVHLAGSGLAKQKWPESIHVVDELPRTPSGKVQKARLREDLREDRL